MNKLKISLAIPLVLILIAASFSSCVTENETSGPQTTPGAESTTESQTTSAQPPKTVDIKNLYNKAKAYAGVYDKNNVPTTSTSHFTTELIAVAEGDRVTFGPCNPQQQFHLHGYGDESTISDNSVNSSRLEVSDSFGVYVVYTYTVPADVAFVRISNAADINDIFVVTRNEIFDADDLLIFTGYFQNPTFKAKFGQAFERVEQGVLVGKSALFAGDSISKGTQDKGLFYNDAWAGRIGKVNSMSFTNASVSGASISTARAANRVVSQLTAHKAKSFDYVILHGGVNDAWDRAAIGNVSVGFERSSFDISTFAGGLEELFYTAKLHFGTSRIGYIINFKAPRDMHGTVANMSAYVEAAKQICKKWGIPYLNLYENDDFCNSVLDVYQKTYLPDSLHPNAGGYDLIYPEVEKFMKTLEDEG